MTLKCIICKTVKTLILVLVQKDVEKWRGLGGKMLHESKCLSDLC